MSAFSKRLAPWFGVAFVIAVAAAAVVLSGALSGVWAQDADTTGAKPRVHLRIDAGSDDTSDDSGVRITIDNDTHTSAADYVRFGDNVHIKPGQRVAGDVVAIGGNIFVEGEVEGDCVAVGGSLHLGPGAQVGGEAVCIGGTLTLDDDSTVKNDVVSVWGTIDRAPTSEVGGQITEVTGPLRLDIPGAIFGFDHGMRYGTWEFLGRLVWLFILIGIGIVAFHLFPSRMDNLADTVQRRGFVSFLAGLAGFILWLPVFVLLCVTLVGIPLAFLLLPLTVCGALLGYVAVAKVVGSRRGTLGVGTSILRGTVLLEGTLLLGLFLSIFGSVFEFLGFILGVIGWSVVSVTATIGWGAFLITRFRPQPADVYARPAPPPPPPYGPPPSYPPPGYPPPGSPPPGWPPPGSPPPPPSYPPPGSTPPQAGPGAPGAGGAPGGGAPSGGSTP